MFQYYIETYGCQMNKCDSEIVAGLLEAEGYIPAENESQADVFLINTCSVREHAENRALGRLASLASWKSLDSSKKLGVIGCMARRMGKDLLDRFPFLNFTLGPDEYRRLPSLLSEKPADICPDVNDGELYSAIRPVRRNGICGWVTIMRGCDNHCSYCIVPHTRGRERSRLSSDILSEIRTMVSEGYREITLLGQNVNSYHDGAKGFAELLEECARVEGVERIRFMTSHPKDMSRDLLSAIASHDRICSHLHLPVQSGSDAVLHKMNRGYTAEFYLERVREARTLIPGISITTDLIVGFPGESASDFQQTIALMEAVAFDDAFTYTYSPRPNTPAASLKEDVSREEKLERLEKIIAVQRRITAEKKNALIGKRVSVLPEAESKYDSEEWMGRTDTNHVVVFPKKGTPLGACADVEIESRRGNTLRGCVAGV